MMGEASPWWLTTFRTGDEDPEPAGAALGTSTLGVAPVPVGTLGVASVRLSLHPAPSVLLGSTCALMSGAATGIASERDEGCSRRLSDGVSAVVSQPQHLIRTDNIG
tara:strand:+ start:2444 stop:2764 length:321 start_codon:yes stop_codon:yes gene_type:complete